MQKITIGLSTKPNFLFQRALKEAAAELNLEIKIADLSEEEHIHWDKVDGVLLPGGPDINPCYYLSSIEKDLREYTREHDYFVKHTPKGKKRDAFEHALLMEYFHNRSLQDLPILGICRGMQMLAVAQGIPLYLDIKQELGFSNPKLTFDEVKLEPNSLMESLIHAQTIKAAKHQHQAIRADYFFDHHERWPHIKLTAFSHEHKIPEAIEFQNRPVLGIQFHPEYTPGKKMKSFFHWLIRMARIRHDKKSQYHLMYAC